MTFSEFERGLNHCPHFTNFWLFLRVGEFCLFVLLTSSIDNGINFQLGDVAGYYFNHVIVQLLGISENDVQCFFGKQFSLLQNLFKAFFERFLVHRMHNFFCNYDAF